MQKADDADKLQDFMNIYKTHVKRQSEEFMTKKQKDPELIDQLDKHCKYMEKQIRLLQETSSKKLKKAKDHIAARTEENKDLIKSLSHLRKEDEKRTKDTNDLDKKITEIQQARRRIVTEIEKMEEQMDKMKIPEVTRPGYHKASTVYRKQKSAENQVADQFRRSQSRGRLIKGSLYNNKPAGLYKQQILDLQKSLEAANETIIMNNVHLEQVRNEYEAAKKYLLDDPGNYMELSEQINMAQMEMVAGAAGRDGPMSLLPPTQTNVLGQTNADGSDRNASRQDIDGQPVNNEHYREQ